MSLVCVVCELFCLIQLLNEEKVSLDAASFSALFLVQKRG